MKLSIICLCYNQEKSIIKLIKSIQYANIVYEIIIVDDNSTDNSIKCIKDLKDDNIKIIKNKDNLNNQSYSRNIGINNSTGDYILFMDGDDYFNSYNLKKFYESINGDIIALQTLHIGDLKYITTLEFRLQEIFHSITMFCINREFLFDNNLFWDEDKYYVDSEDFYYVFNILSNNFNINYYNDFIANVIKNNDSNTNIKYKKETYFNYVQNMCNDLRLIMIEKNNLNMLEYINIYEEKEYYRWLNEQNNNVV